MFKRVMFVLMILLLLVVPALAAAQEPTTEPVEAAAPATDQPQIVVEMQEPDGGGQIDLVLAIAMAALPLLGVLVGGGGVFVFIQLASENKPIKDSTEKLLFDSTPPATINLIHQLAQSGRQVANFIADITDGSPNNPVFTFNLDIPPGADPAEAERVANAALRAHYDGKPSPTAPI